MDVDPSSCLGTIHRVIRSPTRRKWAASENTRSLGETVRGLAAQLEGHRWGLFWQKSPYGLISNWVTYKAFSYKSR